MTSTQKITGAVATAILSPGLIAYFAFGRWSRDNVDISIPAAIYLLPLLAIALVIRHLFHAKRTAVAIYSVGMACLLALAVAMLWGELHAPVFAYIYIPTIMLTFPFGLLAILDTTVAKRKNA